MMCVHEFSLESALTFQRIQGLASLLSQQAMELEHLRKTYYRLVGATEDVEVEGFPVDFDYIISLLAGSRQPVTKLKNSFVDLQALSIHNSNKLASTIGQAYSI